MKRTRLLFTKLITATTFSGLLFFSLSCRPSAPDGNKMESEEPVAIDSGSSQDPVQVAENRESEEERERTMLEKTSGMLQEATDSSLAAAGDAGAWIQDQVQSGYQGGKEVTSQVGQTLTDLFQQAKEQGTTSANSLVDFVKEDYAKMGAWEYASLTVEDRKPDEVMESLNRMGREKWECFWVDKSAGQTTFYFKRSPRSLISKVPFKDLLKFLPELAGGGN